MASSSVGWNGYLSISSEQASAIPKKISLIQPSTFECFLSESSPAYINKINAIEIVPIQRVPKSYSGRYQLLADTYPIITFEPRQIRQYLCKNLASYRLDIWIGGSSVHPFELSYNDIDYKIYADGLNYHDMIDHCLYKFIEELIRKSGFSQELSPYIVKDLYYNDKTLFRDKDGTITGAQYAIGEVSFTLFYNAYPHYHSLSPADGVQYHPIRQVCRFSLGQRFAINEAEALYALDCATYRQYDILSIEDSRDAIFRIVFKLTQEHRVNTITINKAIHKWKQEYTSSERIKKFGKHQLMHYPHQAGKVIDFLNFLSLLSEEADFRALAQDWILTNADSEIDKKLNFGRKQKFAELILRDPSVAPHILNLFRGLFLLAWANPKKEQQSFISAYEFSFRKNSKDVRYSFSLSIDKHVYYLKLPEVLPTQIAISYLDSLRVLKSKFNASFSSVIKVLKPAIACLGLDSSYLICDTSILTRHLIAVFDMPPVKQVLFSSFKHHLKDIYETLGRIANTPCEQLAFNRKSVIAQLKYQSEMISRIDPSFQKCFKLLCDYSEYIHHPPSTTIITDLQSLNTLLPSLCGNPLFQTAGFIDLLKLALPKLIPLIVEKLLFQTTNSEVLKQIKILYQLPLSFEFITREESQEIIGKILQIESSLLKEEKHSPIKTISLFDISHHFISTKEASDHFITILNNAIAITDIDYQVIHISYHNLFLSLEKNRRRLDQISDTYRIPLKISIQNLIFTLIGTSTVKNIQFAQDIFNQSRKFGLLDAVIVDKICLTLIRVYSHLTTEFPEGYYLKNVKKLVSQSQFRSTEEYLVLLTLIKQMLKKDVLQQSFAIECLLGILRNEFLEDELYQQVTPVVDACIHLCIGISEDSYSNALSIFLMFSRQIRTIANQFSDDIYSMLVKIFYQSGYLIREKHVEVLDKILKQLKSKNYFTDVVKSYFIIEAIQRTNIRDLYSCIPLYFFEGSNRDLKDLPELVRYVLWFNSKFEESSEFFPSSYELIHPYISSELEICSEPIARKMIFDCAIKIYARSGNEYALAQVCDLFVRRGYQSDCFSMSIYLLKTISLYRLQDSLVLLNTSANIVKQIMIYDNHKGSGRNSIIQEYLQEFFKKITQFRNEQIMEIMYGLLEKYVCTYGDRINNKTFSNLFALVYLPKVCLLDEVFKARYNRFKTILTQKQLKITNSAISFKLKEHFTDFSKELKKIARCINLYDIAPRKIQLQRIGSKIIEMISNYKDYCLNHDQKEDLMQEFLYTYSKVFDKHSSSDLYYFRTFIELVIRNEIFTISESHHASHPNLLISNRVRKGLDEFLIQCMDLVLDSSAPESTQVLMNCLTGLAKTKNLEYSCSNSLRKYRYSLSSDKVLLMCLKGERELQEYFDFIQNLLNYFKSEKNLLAIDLHLASVIDVTHRLYLYPVLLRHLLEALNKKLIKSKKSQFNHIQQLLNRPINTAGAVDVEKILGTFNQTENPNLASMIRFISLRTLSQELTRGILFCKTQSEFQLLLSTESLLRALEFNKKFNALREEYSKVLESMRASNVHSTTVVPATTEITNHPRIPTELKEEVKVDVLSNENLHSSVTSLGSVEKGRIESNTTSMVLSPSVKSEKKKKKKK